MASSDVQHCDLIVMGSPAVITLMTDYGTRDHYLPSLKGVILSLAPSVTLVDITHDIEPCNIRQGAFVLRESFPWFPRGTIHLAVVDPGVGSSRRILLAQYAGHFFVLPDNGLLSFIHQECPVEALHVVEDPRFLRKPIAPTFHGRDIMAPVAAHLALGARPSDFGRPTDRLEILPLPYRAEIQGDKLIGGVLYVDRFGTLITNLHREQLASFRRGHAGLRVFVNEVLIGPIRSAYHEVDPGETLALIGSSDLLEIAVHQGRAVDRFGPVEGVVIVAR